MTSTLRRFDAPEDRSAWDQAVAAAPHGHPLQSWAWGELKAQFGWRVTRLRLGSACAQVLFRKMPGGMGTIAYIAKGPLVDSTDDVALIQLLDAIYPLAREQRAICLKIEPDRQDLPAFSDGLRALGFRPSPQTIQPRRTLLVDLEHELDELLARMKQKTRYNVRLAGKRGVTVRFGDDGDLPQFYRLMELTSQRDGFGIHTEAYYEAAHRLFVPAGQGCLLLAEREGELLAALVAFALGDVACYMYGASSNVGRGLMPTYLLQWEAMRWAKERGCRVYDLWGVPDEDLASLEAGFAERSDGLWGVYRFKRGFGGQLVRTVGAWDLVYAPKRYRLYAAAVGWLGRRQNG